MADYVKHLRPCPHCGKDVLDHMRECPFCKGQLTPLNKEGWPEEKIKSIRKTLNIIGFLVAAALIVWRLLR
jgi:endogenous inhibitor of DNA gyrase (YacG/DUF329 family)